MPLIFHIGTPMALAHFDPLIEAASRRGLGTVMYSRPGYGGSSRRRGHRIADVAAEVVAILDRLHADRFVTMGWSGGGPRALACAALLGDRCIAAVSIAGVAPYRGSDFDWLAGMTPGNIAEYSAALQGEPALEAYLRSATSRVANVQAEDFVGLLAREGVSATEPLTWPFAEFVAASFRASQANGLWGWLDDDLAEVGDWGFDLANIGRPVSLWHGRNDAYVPFAHAEWLARCVPSARTHFFDGHGHFSLIATLLDRILDDAVALGGVSLRS